MEELTAAQRAELRARAAEVREAALARSAALERAFRDIVASSADAVRDDEHDPEGATIAFERAQVAALLTDARDQVDALTRALQRLDQPGAGRCEGCGGPIGYERLLARPSATRCVACAGRTGDRGPAGGRPRG